MVKAMWEQPSKGACKDNGGHRLSALTLPFSIQAYQAQGSLFFALTAANQPVQDRAKSRHFSS